MKNIKLLILSILLVTLVSCQQNTKDPLVYKEIITKDNLPELIKKMGDDENIEVQDLQYFNSGITRLGVQDSLAGKSVGDVIDMQKEYTLEQNLEATENAANRIAMIMNHNFKYVGIAPKDDLAKPLNVIVYEVTNKSDKEMVDIQGALQFVTPNGNKLVKVYPIRSKQTIEKNGPIKPGETRRLMLPYDHTEGNVRDSIVRNIRQLKHLWRPVTIEFADGTKFTSANEENSDN
jgi:hypothetical protein